jgi:hypothetical protein
MRKKMALLILLALAAPAVWLGSGTDNGLGFGKQIAGGWVATLQMGPQTYVDVLMSFAADGGMVASGQLRPAGEDGTGAWMGTRYNTTLHGRWDRTGRNKVEATGLLQVQNNDGLVVFYEKVRMAATLDKNGTRMEGTGLWQLIEYGQDPLDPEVPIFAQGEFTEVLRKIR